VPDSKASVVDTLERAFDRAMRYLEFGLAALFIVAVGLNFLNVVDRYVFSQSIFGSDEVQVYIMIWITFVGAVIVTWRNQHLRMDVLLIRFPRWARVTILILELVLAFGLAVMMLVQSSRYAYLMHTLNRKSDLGETPMWIPHSALALGFGLIALVIAWRGVVLLVRGRAHALEQSEMPK
jgi:TRAP-type C4-dicarboxylate transport system permease small subunit